MNPKNQDVLIKKKNIYIYTYINNIYNEDIFPVLKQYSYYKNYIPVLYEFRECIVPVAMCSPENYLQLQKNFACAIDADHFSMFLYV